jgi:cytochrome P450
MSLARFNPFRSEFFADPYADYRVYRDREPVHFGEAADPGSPGCWYFFGHADVWRALSDPRLGREADRVLPPAERAQVPEESKRFAEMYQRWMVFRDPPAHTRLRSTVQREFTPSVVAALVPQIESVVGELLDQIDDSGRFELIEQLAYPLPVIVIAQLLGLPPSDRGLFREWALDISGANLLRRDTDPTRYAQAARSTDALAEYLSQLVNERRQRPRGDLLSKLALATKAGEISHDELVATAILLLTAGHETTVHLLGKGCLALLRHPPQLSWLRAHLDRMGEAVEELLRFDSPVQFVSRYVFEDCEYAGQQLRRGDSVALGIAAANRDSQVFASPDQLQLERRPERHATFGRGIHFCLGAALARTEARIAFRALLERFPNLTLSDRPVRYNQNLVFHGLEELWVEPC